MTSTGPTPSASPFATAPSGSTRSGANIAVGLISPTDSQASTLAGSAVSRVVVSAGWKSIEPKQGGFSSSALQQLIARISSMQARGYGVILDLGLQYPPSWVFSLPGQTRFINQYGDVWSGELSEDVPNAVFDPAVREAEATYIFELGSQLSNSGLVGIRVGGLLSGELRYPNADYNGHTESLWDYGTQAQANAPYPGWSPGSGTQQQASQSLSYYFSSLTGYLSWMMRTVDAALPGVNQEVLFPSWGLRPGMVANAIAGGMNGKTNAEVNGMISAGLDWGDQVAAMAASGINCTVYTTWLDAPAQSDSPQGKPPVNYLMSLASKYGLQLGGENTGGGGIDNLELSAKRAQADHLSVFMYMSGALIDTGRADISLSQLARTAGSITLKRGFRMGERRARYYW